MSNRTNLTCSSRLFLRACLTAGLVAGVACIPSGLTPISDDGACRIGECVDDERICHPAVAIRVEHLVTDDPWTTTIEVAMHACGLFGSKPYAECAFAVTCEAPTAACEEMIGSFAAPFTVEASCEAGSLTSVSVVREENQFTSACDGVATYAATDDGFLFRATDIVTGRDVRLYERAVDDSGARILDIDHQLVEGSPSEDYFMNHFANGRITRREWFSPCGDTSDLAGSCPYRIVHYSHNADGEVELVEIDRNGDGVVDEIYVLTYQEGRIAGAFVQSDGGQVEEVLVASCCLDGGPCTDGLAFDEFVFTKAVE